jgi:hypothetical protein
MTRKSKRKKALLSSNRKNIKNTKTETKKSVTLAQQGPIKAKMQNRSLK